VHHRSARRVSAPGNAGDTSRGWWRPISTPAPVGAVEMMAFLDVRPGPNLNKTLAEMADRDGYEPVSIFFRAVADRRIGLTIVFSHRFAWTPRSIKTNLPRIVVISDDSRREPRPERMAMCHQRHSLVEDSARARHRRAGRTLPNGTSCSRAYRAVPVYRNGLRSRACLGCRNPTA
jgi:hypothetical protein